MDPAHGVSTDVRRDHAPAELLERGAHLAAIEDLVSRIGQGDAQCLLFEGPAGIGKTRLLEHAVKTARARGIRVRRAVGDDLETQLPWGLVRRLFGDQSADELPGTAALARPVFAPTLDAGADDAGSPDVFPLLHGLHWLTAQIADEEPQLLVLDDIHWGDPQSLRFVNFLLNRADGLAVGLVLAARTGGRPTEASTAMVARVGSAPATSVREIAALSGPSVTALVRGTMPDATDVFCAAIQDATGGNPFLCREMLSTVRAEAIAPTDEGAQRLTELRHAGIRTSILVRLGQLGHETGAVAAAAAILGPGAAIPRVARLADLDVRAASDALDLLVAADLLEAGPCGLDFVHPIIRETVYADIGPGRRTTTHREAARILHQEGADPADVAAHVTAGGLTEPWVVTTLRQAAMAALHQGAPEHARTLLEAALASSIDAEIDARLLVELARAEAAAGGSSSALARFGQALEALSHSEDDAMVAREIGEALYAAGHFTEAAKAFDRGLDVLGSSRPGRRGSVLEAQLVAGLDMATTLVGTRPPRVEQMLPAAPLTARPPSLASRSLMCLAASRHAFGVGVPPEQRRRAATLELACAALDGDPLPLDLGTVVLEPLALSLLIAGELEQARELLDRLLQTAAERGELPAYASLVTLRGLVNLRAGELGLAAADGADALRLGQEIPSVNSHAAARHVLANASLLSGDSETAARAVNVDDAEERWGGSILYGWYLEASGRVALDRGDPAAASRAFVEAGDRFLAATGPAAYCPWRTGAAQAFESLGDHERALAMADEEVTLAREFGAERSLAEAMRSRARLSPDAEAVILLSEALALVPDGPALTRALTLVDLGAALRRLGRRAEARERLRDGLHLARLCGARPLAEYAAAELQVAGARRPTLAVSGVEALTPSERRVAELAAEGMSNREVAAALFVTRKTVEVHLSACYRKLAIASRQQLPDALG